MGGPVEVGCGSFPFRAGDDSSGVDSMVVYIKVPGNQAGEGNVREGFGWVNQPTPRRFFFFFFFYIMYSLLRYKNSHAALAMA